MTGARADHRAVPGGEKGNGMNLSALCAGRVPGAAQSVAGCGPRGVRRIGKGPGGKGGTA